MELSDHPTVKRDLEQKDSSPKTATQQILDSDMLKKNWLLSPVLTMLDLFL